MSTLEPGSRAGNYEIVRLIGEGGFAAVYEAKHVHLHSQHALKVLLPEWLRRTDMQDRFLAEGRIQAKLRHPHIVAVTDLVAEPGIAGLVLEYVEGKPIDAFWAARKKVAPLSELLSLFEQVLEAVGFAHAHGVVHRDIKPDNVLVTKDVHGVYAVKVLDFGIAKVMDGAGAQKTRTGAIMGTPGYMSPEQVRGGKEVGPPADIWSLGVMLYELVTGRAPFAQEDTLDQMVAIAAAKFEPVAASFGLHVQRAIAGALRVNASERHADCQAFAKYLKEVQAAAARPVAPPIVPRPEVTPPQPVAPNATGATDGADVVATVRRFSLP